jgi:acyl-CoA hydrolase
VTEFGVADLRGLTLAQRTRRMIAIAHPDHQAALEAAVTASRD